MINSHYSGDIVTSNSQEAFSYQERSSYGEKKDGCVQYMNSEALFLINEGKLALENKGKLSSFKEILSKLEKKDKRIRIKHAVYADLRKKGYIVKAALKFGADFRVYEKGAKPGSQHARWIVHCVKQHERIDWQDFAAKNRVAHSTKKKLLIAIVDEENAVSYYEVGWLKP